jgi:hypothetical protein
MLMKSKKQMIHELLASLPDDDVQPASHMDWGGFPGSNAISGVGGALASDSQDAQQGNWSGLGTNLANQAKTAYGTYLGGSLGGLMGGTAANNVLTGQTSGIGTGNGGNPLSAITPQINKLPVGISYENGQNDYDVAQGGLRSSAATLQGIGGQQNSAALQQQGVLAQQQALAGQLQNEANGQGPNPAQAQYQQNIANNTANTAGTIASEKGLSPALQARLIANNQASGAQNAAGSAATLQAQQQLSAQQQLAAQQQAESGTLNSEVSGLGAGGATNQSAATDLGAAGTMGVNEENVAVAGNNGQNASTVAAAQPLTSLLGGFANGAGGALAGLLGGGGDEAATDVAATAAAEYDGGVVGKVPSITKAPASVVARQANPALSAHLMARGGAVPGTPVVNHNSIQNDVVPAVLSKKEIVLPLNVTQAKDAPARAAAFVEALKKHTQPGYGKVVEARKKLEAAKKAHGARK